MLTTKGFDQKQATVGLTICTRSTFSEMSDAPSLEMRSTSEKVQEQTPVDVAHRGRLRQHHNGRNHNLRQIVGNIG